MSIEILRKFDKESNPITYCFNYATSPLIKVDSKRNITYYKSKSQKLNALREAKRSDKFLISWSGQWSTDVFEVTKEDIEQVFSAE
jgi:predicted 3-demethylubiquinone-9 3-methyltransferase (glyoxalase superfamily)